MISSSRSTRGSACCQLLPRENVLVVVTAARIPCALPLKFDKKKMIYNMFPRRFVIHPLSAWRGSQIRPHDRVLVDLTPVRVPYTPPLKVDKASHTVCYLGML